MVQVTESATLYLDDVDLHRADGLRRQFQEIGIRLKVQGYDEAMRHDCRRLPWLSCSDGEQQGWKAIGWFLIRRQKRLDTNQQ